MGINIGNNIWGINIGNSIRLINIGLGHLGWEILPRTIWGAKKNGVGPGPYGPRQDLPGKIFQPRCPRPILINIYIYIYIHRAPGQEVEC